MSRTTQETTMFKPVSKTETVSRTIHEVVEALQEKGYNPIDQIGWLPLEWGPSLCDEL